MFVMKYRLNIMLVRHKTHILLDGKPMIPNRIQ